MDAHPVRMIDYFDGTKQSVIPLFQRPYQWDKEKWSVLWEDIMSMYGLEESDDSVHFMGAIVSMPVKTVPVGVSKYLIIDGQQRLLTLAILLSVIRDKVEGNTKLRIQENYLTNNRHDEPDYLKILPTQDDRDAFLSLVKNEIKTLPDGRIREAHNYFSRVLKEYKDFEDRHIDLEKLLATLENRLSVVMINLKDTDDPYLIFEGLNHKGMDLTEADLVRNFILMRFKHSIGPGSEQESVYNKLWKPMQDDQGKGFSDFLRFYAMSRGENVRKKQIYSAIKKSIPNSWSSDDLVEEIHRMKEYSDHYLKLIDPSKEGNKKLRKHLEAYNGMSQVICRPLILRLYEARDNEKICDEDLSICFSMIESYLLRHQIMNLANNTFQVHFIKLCSKLDSVGEKIVDWLEKELCESKGANRWVTDAELERTLLNVPVYERGVLKYMLEQIERNFEHLEPADLSKTTIEHIMPQKLTGDWQEMLGEDYRDIHQKYLHTLGNLTLTGYNSELGNFSFEEKKEKLKGSHIELNRWICKQDKWTESEIVDRGKMLIELVKKIWTRP